MNFVCFKIAARTLPGALSTLYFRLQESGLRNEEAEIKRNNFIDMSSKVTFLERHCPEIQFAFISIIQPKPFIRYVFECARHHISYSYFLFL